MLRSESMQHEALFGINSNPNPYLKETTMGIDEVIKVGEGG